MKSQKLMHPSPKYLIASLALSIAFFIYGYFLSFFIGSLNFGTTGRIISFILMLIPTLPLFFPYYFTIQKIVFKLFENKNRLVGGNSEIDRFNQKLTNISAYCTLGLSVIWFIVGYWLYKVVGFSFNLDTLLLYFRTGPVIIILIAIIFIPFVIRILFSWINDLALTNIIHVLIIALGIIITIPVYNANPGASLFPSNKIEADTNTDDFGNTEINAFSDATHEVEKQLKSPSTAEFCPSSDAQITLDGNTWIVKGWVEAQNSYGAQLRNNFSVKITYVSKDSYSVDYCSIH